PSNPARRSRSPRFRPVTAIPRDSSDVSSSATGSSISQLTNGQISLALGAVMSFRRFVAASALAVVASSWVFTADAQFGGGPPAYTPEPDARDLKAVLFNWAWHMGMLRGQAEPEL